MHVYVYGQIKYHSEMSLHLWEGSGVSYIQDLIWKCLKGLVDPVTSLLKRVCMFTYINHITAVCYFEKKKKSYIDYNMHLLHKNCRWTANFPGNCTLKSKAVTNRF